MTNFVIVHTGHGASYAKKISRSIKWINKHKPINGGIHVKVAPFHSIESAIENLRPENTVIYARAAYPDRSGWMSQLFNAEEAGFRVINKPEILALTSNKLKCALHLQGKVPHPRTWELDKTNPEEYQRIFADDTEGVCDFILKPETSISQGAHVVKFHFDDVDSRGDLDNLVQRIPSRKVVLQEFVPYDAIYRVIVIGGKALPYSFVDKPEWHTDNWKVSVCLNKTTMQFVENPDVRLLELAERTQREIGGEINFIDIFEYEDWSDEEDLTGVFYTISEINTACNLSIHESLAKAAGHSEWNIHYRIAKYLVNQARKG